MWVPNKANTHNAGSIVKETYPQVTESFHISEN